MASIVTDALAVLMVLFAVVGMVGIVALSRQSEMMSRSEQALTVIGAAFIIAMTAVTLF
ncbi:MAG: hypothetical protein ACI8UR_000478 [Natronomonas sp.]|jgi:hypothetical protein|uniref:hypothetical protein n=1 Tax=Natronomonas sp. TaxID=2184060 RepID=UPI00398970DF